MDAQKFTEFEALKEISFSDPAILFALTTAVIGDVTSLLIVTHYVAALFIGFIILPKIHGLLPRIVLWLSFLLPVPFILILGIAVAIILSNKLVELLAVTAVLVAITVATVGTSAPATAAAEAGVVGAEAATVGAGAIAAETGAEAAVAGTAATGEAAGSAAADVGAQAAERGVQEVAERGAEQAAPKTLGQKAKERGLRYAQQKLETRRDQLREELFHKDAESKDRQEQEISTNPESSGEQVIDLRGKGDDDGPMPI